MNLTTEQKLAINMKVAQDMRPITVVTQLRRNCVEVSVHTSDIDGFIFNIFDPDNTTDLNKAVEFYGIDCVLWKDVWCCRKGNDVFTRDVSRRISQEQAVTAASGVTV